jgi:5-methylcytosine-specific restriction protein A
MGLADISRREVLAAIAEYDRLGAEAFRERYGFGPARSYYLVQDSKRYDSKAIVGAAHGFLPGRSPLTAAEFSGGAATVGRLLTALGFAVEPVHLWDDSGRELNAEFRVEPDSGRLALVLESSGGKTPPSSRWPTRNSDYNAALDLLLERLQRMNAVIIDALLDSAPARRMPDDERRLLDQVPVPLPGADLAQVHRELGAHMAAIGRSSDSNRTKKLRLVLDVPGYGPVDADALFKTLATGQAMTISELIDRIARLPVNRADGHAGLDGPIVLLWAFGRVANGQERRLSWRETRDLLRPLLERANKQQTNAELPLAALCRAGLWELDGVMDMPPTHEHEVERWFAANDPAGGLVTRVYDLLRSSEDVRNAAIAALIRPHFSGEDVWVEILGQVGLDWEPLLRDQGLAEMLAQDTQDTQPAAGPMENALAREYARLCEPTGAVQQSADRLRKKGVMYDAVVRSARVRIAVLRRSEGRCEYCDAHLDDVTDQGHPILEVDHVTDLALHGGDRPENMIAICPNCHALKTRGRKREELRAKFREVVRQRHEDFMRKGRG